MTWLKKIGLDVLKYLPVLLGLGNLAVQAAPSNTTVKTVVGDLNALPELIVQGEALIKAAAGQKTGAAKLAAVAPGVQALLTTYVENNLPGSPKVKNPQAAATAAAGITSSLADFLNAFE